MPTAPGTPDGPEVVPRLILTQDSVSAAEWRALLEPVGIITRHWPAFQIEALSEADILAAFDGQPDGIVLPSPAAVRVTARVLQRAGRRWPAGVWAGLPGAGSAHAFTRHVGLGPRLVVPPPPYQDAAHLARLVLCLSPRPRRIVVLNRPDGRRDWAAVLQAEGIRVDWQPAYQAQWCTAVPAGFHADWQHWQAAETAAGMAASGGSEGSSDVPGAEHAVHHPSAIGHETAEVLAAAVSGQPDWPGPSDETEEDMVMPQGGHWLIGSAAVLRTVAGWLATLPSGLAAFAAHRPVWLPHPRLVDVARGQGFGTPRVYHDRHQLIERLQSDEFRSNR